MKMKRIISLAIALLLVCGMPVSAFAEYISENPADTTISVSSDQTLDTNKGTVTTNDGIVMFNKGTVEDNNNDMANNHGTVENNNNGANVTANYGTVENNNGTVGANQDSATVDTNSGTVRYNYGTVDNNSSTGKVNINSYNATVTTNNGTVTTNNGTVDTNEITGNVTNYEGTVGTNYGTVTYVKDNEEMTVYGVQVEGSLFQKEHEAELDLSQFFSKAGYVLTGYIQHYQMGSNGPVPQDGLITVDGTVYKEDCPNLLTLIWQAIAGSDEETEYFGPGCYISVNGKQYILVEIKGEDYYLASCEEYTQEDLAEADELLESLLTEEQLGHVTGEAGILEGELNELFFGGGSRIVFPCDIGMIFH